MQSNTKYHDTDLSFENDNLMTKQSFKDECCINNIMSKYEKTGILPEGFSTPQYGDFSDMPDFQSMHQMVMDARQSFMSLPAQLRTQFDNDPVKFMDFVSNPANFDEMVKMGLVQEQTQSVSVADPQQSSEASKQTA